MRMCVFKLREPQAAKILLKRPRLCRGESGKNVVRHPIRSISARPAGTLLQPESVICP